MWDQPFEAAAGLLPGAEETADLEVTNDFDGLGTSSPTWPFRGVVPENDYEASVAAPEPR